MDIVPQKQCTKCGRILPITEFYTSGQHGLRQPNCKDCKKAAERERYRRDPERIKQQSAQWRNDHKEYALQRDREYHYQHREKRNERAKAYHREYRKNPVNREKMRQYHLQWRRDNPERQILKNARRKTRRQSLPNNFTSQDWQNCLEYWGHKCAYCDTPNGLFMPFILTLEHFVPLAVHDSPGTIPTNILPICHSCNSSKSNRDALEWLEYRFGKRKASLILERIYKYFETLA